MHKWMSQHWTELLQLLLTLNMHNLCLAERWTGMSDLQTEDAQLEPLGLWLRFGAGLLRWHLRWLAQISWKRRWNSKNKNLELGNVAYMFLSVTCMKFVSQIPFCCLAALETCFITTPSMPFRIIVGEEETKLSSSQLSDIFCSTFSSSAARPARSIS